MNLKFLPKFMRPGDSSETSDSDYGSASEEETYDDCVNDLEQKISSSDCRLPLDNHTKAIEGELPAIQSSIYPPVSSTATEAAEGRFNDLKPTYPPLSSRVTEVEKECFTNLNPAYPPLSSMFTVVKEECFTDQNPTHPPLTSIATAATEGCFTDLSPTDDFDATLTPFKSAAPQRISTLSKETKPFARTDSSLSWSGEQKVDVAGSTVYKNKLQTLCQRRRINLPAYRDEREGPAHQPKFKAAVEVNGNWHVGEGDYGSKGEAEQAAAKVALSILGQPDITSTITPAVRQSSFDYSNASASTADPIIRVKNVKPKAAIWVGGGSTIETAIDLTEEEQSVGSSPPLSTASSPAFARAQSASRSHDQLWAALKNHSTPVRDYGAAPGGIDNQVRGIASQFSGLQLNKASAVPEFAKLAPKPQSVQWPPQTEHLEALGKLEFSTHGFQVLSRLNGLPLEEVYSVFDIEGLQDFPAAGVIPYLDRLQKGSTTSSPPPKVNDPKFLLYDCTINSDGKRIFTAVTNKQGSTLLQRTLGFDKVLRVFFEGKFLRDHYREVFKNGIFVGPRLYQYFVHKPSNDFEEKKNPDGVNKKEKNNPDDLNDRAFKRFSRITEVRLLFMHVDTCETVAKFNARLQLCLSKTMTITDISFSDLVIRELEDVQSKDPLNSVAWFTDGTGFISTDLARLMPTSIFEGMSSEETQGNDFNEDYPSLIQVRFFHGGSAFKGTLLANEALPPNTIECYKSMKKVQGDPSIRGSSISSFELVTTSKRPRRAKLSQDLIVLLAIGGVHESVFLEAMRRASQHVFMILHNRKRAVQELLEWEWESDLVETTLLMLAAGIPMEEPALQKNLLILTKNKLQDFAKGKVPLEGSFYIMGTVDPSGTLKAGEVVIFVDGCLIYGTVLVYRSSGKHPGDPHKVQAVHCKALEDMVGGAKNAIFFSIQGTRPLPHEIANGDLDGDMFWVCKNKKVVGQFKEWPSRWNKGEINFKSGKGQRPLKELSPAQLEEALATEFFYERFSKSSVVGIASTRWLSHVDSYLHPETSAEKREIHKNEFLKYPDYIYEGVDTKSGKQEQCILPPEHEIMKDYKRPPYLWKNPPQNLDSNSDLLKGEKSLLGKIYEFGLVTLQETKKPPSYGREDFEIDPAFLVQGSERYLNSWDSNYARYRGDMARALNQRDSLNVDPKLADQVKENWKMVLYGGRSFKERTKDLHMVLEEASAIYQVVYRRAGIDSDSGQSRFAFAWNIAGAALTYIYAERQPGGNSIVFAPSAFR